MRLLMIDDERTSFEILKATVDWKAFDIVPEYVESAAQAMDKIKQDLPDIILTDIMMPGMDGFELIEWIKANSYNCEILILTAYGTFEYARKALRYGAFDYLLKPVSEESLDNLLSRARTRLSELYELPEDERNNMSGEEYVQLAIRYLNEHYMEDIDISLMASELGFHSAYLTRLFGRYAGVTPLKYLTNLRIQEAKRLLLDTSLPISVVGERVGYPDQFHFSKTFRKATGVNPSAFRKQEKESL